MKNLIYILLFTLTAQAQNLVLDCSTMIYEKQFVKVSDTLKVDNSSIMMQSNSGLKVNIVGGNLRVVHGRLALEENDFVKPILIINKCLDDSNITVSDRINLLVNDDKCKKIVTRFKQLF